jgi:hypothetical protein
MNRHTARRIAVAIVANIGDLVRVCALLAAAIVVAQYIAPGNGVHIDSSPLGIVVIALALLGVERIGLALHSVAVRLGYVRPQQLKH